METTGKEKIILEFFRHGHLLTDSAIRTLEERQAYEDVLDSRLPLVVDSRDLEKGYRIIKNITSKKTELTKDDFVRFYNSKYNKMRNVITARLQKDFMSLNKVDSTRSEVYVIGIVKDIREKDGKKTVELEDTTTSIPVLLDDVEDLALDDVVAIKAVSGGRVLYGKKILYPDIPLRNPTTGLGKACFVSDLRLDEAPQSDAEKFFEWLSRQDIPFLFVSGKTGDRQALERYVERYCYMKTVFVISEGDAEPADNYHDPKIISLSNPSMVEVSGIKILVAQKADTTMLKKRHINSRAVLDDDMLVIDEVPDIVHSGNSNSPSVINYKSVTLVNSGSLLGEFRPIIVDFATRDVEKIRIG